MAKRKPKPKPKPVAKRKRKPKPSGGAVASGTYSGRTAQGFPFEVRVSGGFISHLTFKVKTDCDLPFNGSLAEHIRIGSDGAFRQETSNTILDGAFHGDRVTGSIRGGFENPESGTFCDGKSTFTARLASG